MTVLNTADWLLSCSTPSSATSMRDAGTVHACAACPHDCCVTSLHLLQPSLMHFEHSHGLPHPFSKAFPTARKLLESCNKQLSYNALKVI